MRRMGMVLGVVTLVFASTSSPAVGDWSADQTPADQELWRIAGPSACPEVFFIGLRGSGQNGEQAGPIDFGDQIEQLFREYSASIHGSELPDSFDGVRVAPVSPPGYRAVLAADWSALLDPVGIYWESVDEGAAAIVRFMRQAATRCGEHTKFVLAGFSQGAQAVTEALPSIPTQVRPRVAAVLLVASPTWRGDQGITYFGYDAEWNGSLAGACVGACGGAIKSWAASRTAALCYDGDAVCTGDGFLPIHADYTLADFTELALWAADRTAVDTAIPFCDGRRATHVGTAAADVVKGTPHDDVVVTFAGDDRVATRSGNDRVCAGSGNDTVTGGPGADRLWAGVGADAVNGGPGNDRIWGQAGHDRSLDGAAGNDVIHGAGGDDELLGGNGRDTLNGGAGDDVCDGGRGVDTYETCEITAGG